MNLLSRLSRYITAAILALTALTTSLSHAQDSTATKPVDPKHYLLRPDVEAEVFRSTDGRLNLRWTPDSNVVEIYTGTRPNTIDRTKPLLRVEGKKEAELPDLPAGTPHFFELRFQGGSADGKYLTVAERFLPLKGASNFRDLGGYRTADGHHVRWGIAYRAEGLNKLTESDLNYLSGNLKLVCDLRGESEIKTAQDRLPEKSRPEVLNLPIPTESGALRKLMATVFKGDLQTLDEAMAQGYIGMVDTRGEDVFGPLLKRFADVDSLPAVYHCTAGKDRTGVATALLLSLLGVPEKTVIADYSLTNLAFDNLMAELRDNKTLKMSGLAPEKFAPLMIANPIWMERTLKHIHEKYGSVESYLKTVAKLDDATLTKIRANLLE